MRRKESARFVRVGIRALRPFRHLTITNDGYERNPGGGSSAWPEFTVATKQVHARRTPTGWPKTQRGHNDKDTPQRPNYGAQRVRRVKSPQAAAAL
jgi:hypothetical protein